MNERRGIAVAEMLSELFTVMTLGQDRVLSCRAYILIEAENWMRVRWSATLLLDEDDHCLLNTGIPSSFLNEEKTVQMTWSEEAGRTSLSKDFSFQFIDKGNDVEAELDWDSVAIPSEVAEAAIRSLDGTGTAERLLDGAGADGPNYSLYPERLQLFLRAAVRTYRGEK
jgi:hypothetical protein